MKSETVTISMDESLDAMSLAYCVQTACRFTSRIHLTDGTRRINAKSIMGMMSLGIAMGDAIVVEAEGEDEEAAAAAMKEILEGKNGSV